MRKLFLLISLITSFFIFYGCEEDITLDLPKAEEKLVVEGYIEPGLPPIITLTRTMPYFSKTDLTTYSKMFVSGANIRVSDGKDTIKLLEINFSSLPDSIIKILADGLQLSVDNLKNLNFSIYSSISMFGVAGKTYSLIVDKDNYHLEATTTIPLVVVPDSFWIEPHPDVKNDSLVSIVMKMRDPVSITNYYRYFTKRNNEPYYPNRFISVIDDKLISGQEIKWPISRGESRTGAFDPLTYSYFKRGDTVTIKFCTIDEAHYNFWSTLEIENNNGGPFANPVHIISNIKGGVGIWGGYGSYYQKIIIP